jgi:hypothetical protein
VKIHVVVERCRDQSQVAHGDLLKLEIVGCDGRVDVLEKLRELLVKSS